MSPHPDPYAERNETMQEWSRQWLLEGDIVRCPYCHNYQPLSRGHRVFVHQAGCKGAQFAEQYPWRWLAWNLRDL